MDNQAAWYVQMTEPKHARPLTSPTSWNPQALGHAARMALTHVGYSRYLKQRGDGTEYADGQLEQPGDADVQLEEDEEDELVVVEPKAPYSFPSAENPDLQPSSKLTWATQKINSILKEDGHLPDGERRKILVFTEYPKMEEIIERVSPHRLHQALVC